jgi:hypothetical protein
LNIYFAPSPALVIHDADRFSILVIYIFEIRRICQRLLLNFNPTIVPLIVSPQATFNSRYIYRVTDNIAEKLFAPLKSLTNQNANLNPANFD